MLVQSMLVGRDGREARRRKEPPELVASREYSDVNSSSNFEIKSHAPNISPRGLTRPTEDGLSNQELRYETDRISDSTELPTNLRLALPAAWLV